MKINGEVQIWKIAKIQCGDIAATKETGKRKLGSTHALLVGLAKKF